MGDRQHRALAGCRGARPPGRWAPPPPSGLPVTATWCLSPALLADTAFPGCSVRAGERGRNGQGPGASQCTGLSLQGMKLGRLGACAPFCSGGLRCPCVWRLLCTFPPREPPPPGKTKGVKGLGFGPGGEGQPARPRAGCPSGSLHCPVSTDCGCAALRATRPCGMPGTVRGGGGKRKVGNQHLPRAAPRKWLQGPDK